MKKILSIAFLITAISFSVAVQAQEKPKWKEMEDFHTVMAATFHPAEEGNLQPIRTRSQEMVDKATAWKQSSAPEGYDKKAVNSTLTKLVTGAKEIDKMIKANATDKELTEKLSKLHDIFHQIMEKCRKEDHHS
jgi:phosphomevalonate kinase